MIASILMLATWGALEAWGEANVPLLLIAQSSPVYYAIPLLWSVLRAIRCRSGAGIPWLVPGLLAWLGPLMGFGWAQARPTDAPTIRVVTFNVEHTRHGFDKVADALRRADADIVCLQESPLDFPSPQADAYTRFLDEHHWFRLRESGLLIASRFPITGKAILPLQIEKGDYILAATVDVRGTPVTVLDTHLIPVHGGHYPLTDVAALPKNLADVRRFRERQMRDVLTEVDARDGPIILCGDFNRNPFGPEYAAIRRRLEDTWADVGRGYGFTSGDPVLSQRVDYVLTRGFRTHRAWVEPVRASDHAPYVAEISLSTR